jgi:hypothetical protein
MLANGCKALSFQIGHEQALEMHFLNRKRNKNFLTYEMQDGLSSACFASIQEIMNNSVMVPKVRKVA